MIAYFVVLEKAFRYFIFRISTRIDILQNLWLYYILEGVIFVGKISLGCVIMAAGNARRFGANKLAAKVDGKSLIRRTMEAIPAAQFDKITVVTQYPEIEALADEFGFQCIRNEHPDWGISHTISLGLTPLSHLDAVMFQVSDQPMLQKNSIDAMLNYYRQHSDKIVGLSHDGVRGNPCIFPARFFPELLTLQEDHGGNTVIRRHEEDLLLYEVDGKELFDVDTPEQLAKL